MAWGTQMVAIVGKFKSWSPDGIREPLLGGTKARQANIVSMLDVGGPSYAAIWRRISLEGAIKPPRGAITWKWEWLYMTLLFWVCDILYVFIFLLYTV